MWKGILPIGSVVLLKDSTRRLVVIGQCVSKAEGGRIYDYAGCLYPEGMSVPEKTYLFDGAYIERVYHIGYMDENSAEFLPKIESILEERKKQEALP